MRGSMCSGAQRPLLRRGDALSLPLFSPVRRCIEYARFWFPACQEGKQKTVQYTRQSVEPSPSPCISSHCDRKLAHWQQGSLPFSVAPEHRKGHWKASIMGGKSGSSVVFAAVCTRMDCRIHKALADLPSSYRT